MIEDIFVKKKKSNYIMSCYIFVLIKKSNQIFNERVLSTEYHTYPSKLQSA